MTAPLIEECEARRRRSLPAAAAACRRCCQRTRLTALAIPVILALDTAAITAASAAAPAMTWALGAAVADSLTRIAFTSRTLPRLAPR